MNPPHPKKADLSLPSELHRRLAEALESAGWKVRAAPALGRSDLLVEKKGVRYAVEIKFAREARRVLLHALLADALLRARHAAKSARARPLAVVGVPNLSDALMGDLRAYAEKFSDGDAWGAIDGRGRLELFGPSLEGVRGSELAVGSEAEPRARAFDPFSDLGQWMLKVLLARRLPLDLLSAPREPVRNARHLAHLAEVSVPSAARLVAHLRSEGHLEDSRKGLQLVRVDELLERWRRANARPAHELPARFLLPGVESRKRLELALHSYAFENVAPFDPDPPPRVPGSVSWREGPRACLGLYSAGAALEFGIVHGAPVHLYIENASAPVLEGFEMGPARVGESPHVRVRVPRFRESVFRGMVLRRGIPSADVIQCWLDVSYHPVRGSEQAEEIHRRVIEPWLMNGKRS